MDHHRHPTLLRHRVQRVQRAVVRGQLVTARVDLQPASAVGQGVSESARRLRRGPWVVLDEREQPLVRACLVQRILLDRVSATGQRHGVIDALPLEVLGQGRARHTPLAQTGEVRASIE